MRLHLISLIEQIGAAFGRRAGQRRSSSVISVEARHPWRRPASRHLASVFGLFFLAGIVNAGPSFASGGPYVVDDHEIPAPGACQIESWASGGGTTDRIFVTAPSCTFESLPVLEVGMAVERSRASGDWATAVTPSLKASVVPLDRFGLGIGMAGSVGLDWTERRVTDVAVAGLFTVQPVEPMRIHVNLGYERDQVQRRDFAVWGVGAAFEPVENLAVIAEAFGRDRGRMGVQAGVRSTPLGVAFDFDLVVGRNLTDTSAIWLTVGAAVLF